MSNTILKLEHIDKNYIETGNTLHILKDLNMEIKKGEFVSILGRSGSGKSSLLNIIGMLDKPSSGKIYIDSQEIQKLNDKEKDRLKNKTLGFVFQFHYLLPEFTALENVMLPGLITKKSKNEIEARAKYLLTLVGLKDRLLHKPSQLSGGEKQRVAIARALINEPKILLADEPTGNLDYETSENIFKILKEINEKNNQTIIVVTHSQELANISDRCIFINKL